MAGETSIGPWDANDPSRRPGWASSGTPSPDTDDYDSMTVSEFFARTIEKYRGAVVFSDKVLYEDGETGASVTVGDYRKAISDALDLIEPGDPAEETEVGSVSPYVPSYSGVHHALPFTLGDDVSIDSCDVHSQADDWYERRTDGIRLNATDEDGNKVVRYLTEYGYQATSSEAAFPLWPLVCERIGNDTFAPIIDPAGLPIDVLTIATWAAHDHESREGNPTLAYALLALPYGHINRLFPSKTYPLEDSISDGGTQESSGSDWRRPESALWPQPVTNHFLGTSKLSRNLSLLDLDGSMTELRVGGRGEPNVSTFVSLRYDSPGVTTSQRLSTFDGLVNDAIVSINKAGISYFTIRQVCSLMGWRKPSKAATERVRASIEKLSMTLVSMDFSDELRGKTCEIDGEQVTAESCRLSTYMVALESAEVTAANGSRYTLYRILREPALYYHDRRVRQLTTFPQRYFEEVADKTRIDPDVMALMKYIIREIDTMRSPHASRSNRIRYDTAFEGSGIEINNRVNKQRAVKKVSVILDMLVREGAIDGWSEYESGSSHEKVGVTIRLPRRKGGRKPKAGA